MEAFLKVMVVLLIISVIGNIWSSEKRKKEEAQGIIRPKKTSFGGCKYYGGYDDIMDIKDVIVRYSEEGYFFLSFFTQEKKIPICDVNDISTKTELQLKEEVSLGRFLLVGNLAFLWKKNKVTNKKFIVISYFDKTDDKHRNIVVESSMAELVYKEMNDIFKKYKQENLQDSI